MSDETPTFVEIRARDLVPYKHAIWCTVGDCKEPFANIIMSVRWRDDGKIAIALDSHNFDSHNPDDLVECVVERRDLTAFERAYVAKFALRPSPKPPVDPRDEEIASLRARVAELEAALKTAERERDEIARRADRQFNAICEAIDASGVAGITAPERIGNLARERDAARSDAAWWVEHEGRTRAEVEADESNDAEWDRLSALSDEEVRAELASDGIDPDQSRDAMFDHVIHKMAGGHAAMRKMTAERDAYRAATVAAGAYFDALGGAWQDNDGRLVGIAGGLTAGIVTSGTLDELFDAAHAEITAALAAKEGEK